MNNQRETKFKVKKISNKKDKKMIGLLMKVGKKAAERIDENTLRLIIGKYGKKWVNKILDNENQGMAVKET